MSCSVHWRTPYPDVGMEKSCADCPEPRGAQGLCTLCNKWLCSQCTETHQDHRRAVSTGSTYCPSAPPLCPLHGQEPLELFCETCQLLSCSRCHLSTHQDHRLVHVGKALRDQHWLLESLMAQMEDRRSTVENSAKQIESRLHSIKIMQKKAENQIKMAKMIMMNELNKRANLLTEQLKKLSNDSKRPLEEQLQGMVDLCGQLDHMQNFITWAVSQGRGPLLFSKDLITLQVQHLLESQFHTDVVPPVKIKFNWDASVWTKQISALGHLSTEGGSGPHSEACPNAQKSRPITCSSLPASLCHRTMEPDCGYQVCFQCCSHCVTPNNPGPHSGLLMGRNTGSPGRRARCHPIRPYPDRLQPGTRSPMQLDKKQLDLNPYIRRCVQPNHSFSPVHYTQLQGPWDPKSPLALVTRLREPLQPRGVEEGGHTRGSCSPPSVHTRGSCSPPSVHTRGSCSPPSVHTRGSCSPPSVHTRGSFSPPSLHTRGSCSPPSLHTRGSCSPPSLHTRGSCSPPSGQPPAPCSSLQLLLQSHNHLRTSAAEQLSGQAWADPPSATDHSGAEPGCQALRPAGDLGGADPERPQIQQRLASASASDREAERLCLGSSDYRVSGSLEMSAPAHGLTGRAPHRLGTAWGRRPTPHRAAGEPSAPAHGLSEVCQPGATRSLATAAGERDDAVGQGGLSLHSQRRGLSDGKCLDVVRVSPSALSPYTGFPLLCLSPLTTYKIEPENIYVCEDKETESRFGQTSQKNIRAEREDQVSSKRSRIPYVRLERLKVRSMPGQLLMSWLPPRGDYPEQATGGAVTPEVVGSLTDEEQQEKDGPSEKLATRLGLKPLEQLPANSPHSSPSEITECSEPGCPEEGPRPQIPGGPFDLESDAGADSESESEPRSETEPELESESELESEPGLGMEQDPESESGLVTEPRTESESGLVTEPHTESESGLVTEPQTELESEREMELETASESKLESSQPESGPERGTEPCLGSEANLEPETDRDSGSWADVERDSGSRPDVDRDSGSRPDIDRDSGSQPDVDRDSVSRPDVDRDSGSRPDVDRDSGSRPDLATEEEADPSERSKRAGLESELTELRVESAEMENDDFCAVCLNGGDLLCCDHCPKVFHLSCHVPPLLSFPTGDWVCTLCRDVQQPEAEDHENDRLSHADEGGGAQQGLSECDLGKCEKLTLFISCNILSAPFHEPVSPLARHYYQIIKKPMDLSVIRSKLNKSNPLQYLTPEEFVADVFLMFRNCAKFNYPDSEVAQAGRSLEAFFSSKLKEVFPERVFPALDEDSDSEDYEEAHRAASVGFPWPDGKEHCHRKRRRRPSLHWRRHHF